MLFLKTTIKLFILPTKVTATPPIGPVLSQNGINALDFAKTVNDLSIVFSANIALPILVLLYSDFSYFFFIKLPTFNSILKKILALDKNSKFFFVKKKKKKNYILNYLKHNLIYYSFYLSSCLLIELLFLLYKHSLFSNSFSAIKMYTGTLQASGIYVLQY